VQVAVPMALVRISSGTKNTLMLTKKAAAIVVRNLFYFCFSIALAYSGLFFIQVLMGLLVFLYKFQFIM
jgi:hypothetical protein